MRKEPASQGRIEPVGAEAKGDDPSSSPTSESLCRHLPLAAPLCRTWSPAPHRNRLWGANRTPSRAFAQGPGQNGAPAALPLGCPIHCSPLMPVCVSLSPTGNHVRKKRASVLTALHGLPAWAETQPQMMNPGKGHRHPEPAMQTVACCPLVGAEGTAPGWLPAAQLPPPHRRGGIWGLTLRMVKAGDPALAAVQS